MVTSSVHYIFAQIVLRSNVICALSTKGFHWQRDRKYEKKKNMSNEIIKCFKKYNSVEHLATLKCLYCCSLDTRANACGKHFFFHLLSIPAQRTKGAHERLFSHSIWCRFETNECQCGRILRDNTINEQWGNVWTRRANIRPEQQWISSQILWGGKTNWKISHIAFVILFTFTHNINTTNKFLWQPSSFIVPHTSENCTIQLNELSLNFWWV